MKGKTFSLILFLLLITLVFNAQGEGKVLINEVMYNPSDCPDTKCEWIELFYEGSGMGEEGNLSTCFLNDKKLSGILKNHSYLVLVRHNESFATKYGKRETLEIAFNLKNNGDVLSLSGVCNDTFDYTPYIQWAAANNFTLERRGEGSWGESLVNGGTPGSKNSIDNFTLQYTSLKITEIMPDPIGEENAAKPWGEWIELYNEGKKMIDLKRLTVYDLKGSLPIALNKVLDGTIICGGCYKVIYRDGDHDFSLNSDYDEVTLLLNQTIIDSVSYAGATEGMSWSKIKGQWFQTVPTPGLVNQYQESCDWGIDVDVGKGIYGIGEGKFQVVVQREAGLEGNVTGKGVIVDAEEKQVKEYQPWQQDRIVTQATKTYEPALKEGVYTISFWLENLSCSDFNLKNNNVSRVMAIKSLVAQSEVGNKSSSISIKTLSANKDKTVEWGGSLGVTLAIYKGDETKKVVQLWVEKNEKKISDVTKLSLENAFREYTLTVPVQLRCPTSKDKDGNVVLHVQGLGLTVEESFMVEGVHEDYCLERETSVAVTPREKFAVGFVNLPGDIISGDVVRVQVQISNDEKARAVSVESYLYRGSKCYSCVNQTREPEKIMMKVGETKIVDVLVKSDADLKGGIYKIKASVLKEGLKTPQQVTADIYVQEREDLTLHKNSSLLFPVLGQGGGQKENPEKWGVATRYPESKMIVYESNAVKAKRMIPHILLVSFGFLLLIVIFRR